MKPTPLTVLVALLLTQLTALLAAAEPKLTVHPFPGYSREYLTFAMAASTDSTSKGFHGSCSKTVSHCFQSGKLLLDERANVSCPDIAETPGGDICIHS
ncbi:MAG: hypothetical protein RL215_3243, partial [Planctomycetota bacterium]